MTYYSPNTIGNTIIGFKTTPPLAVKSLGSVRRSLLNLGGSRLEDITASEAAQLLKSR